MREEGAHRIWNLATDVSGDILAGNPHADSLGHRDVWHFYHEAISGESSPELVSIPTGSLLDRWRDEARVEERTRLARQIQSLLIKGPEPGTSTARCTPLRSAHLPGRSRCSGGSTLEPMAAGEDGETREATSQTFGLPPEMFGKHPKGGEADRASLHGSGPLGDRGSPAGRARRRA